MLYMGPAFPLGASQQVEIPSATHHALAGLNIAIGEIK